MHISIIAAMSKDLVLGSSKEANRFGLLWDIPEDRKLFKSLTEKKSIILGRKTFEAMGASPLPNRRNIILTRRVDTKYKNCETANSFDSAVKLCCQDEEIMVCGGGSIYKNSIDFVDRMYLSVIDGRWEGDIFFPKVDWTKWRLVKEEKKQGFVFYIWDRKP
jgi:dihydrofolate reductase